MLLLAWATNGVAWQGSAVPRCSVDLCRRVEAAIHELICGRSSTEPQGAVWRSVAGVVPHHASAALSVRASKWPLCPSDGFSRELVPQTIGLLERAKAIEYGESLL